MDNSNKEIKYKLKENENPYTLTISIKEKNLLINILEDDSLPSISYSTKFELNDLIKQSRYFKLFESIEELIPEIQNMYKENRIKIKKEKSSINLILFLPLKVVEEINLIIPQDDINSKQVIVDLCQTVNELKRQIKNLNSNQISEEQIKENLKSKNILLNEEEKIMINNWILKSLKSEGKKVEMTLLYKIKIHGDSSSTFHTCCDNKGYTLTLIRNTKGYRCGGFTTKNWSKIGGYCFSDENAFLFSLEYKEQYFTYDGYNAINNNSSCGPIFGSGPDLSIGNGCTNNYSSVCNFPTDYYGNKIRCLTGGWKAFKVDDMEVYKIDII